MDQRRSFPVSVIGYEFMAPYEFDLIVDTNSGGNIIITDINHNILLQVKPCDTMLHHQRMLLDADGRPIVRLREKIMTTHNRWKAYRGDSTSSSSKLFSTKEPNMIQFKTGLHVFLANKKSGKDVCDFKIEGSWSKRKCKISSMGDSKSSTTIAQMHKFQKSKKDKFDKGKFLVTIYPNVDYAFVVTLIAIIDAMKNIDKEVTASATEMFATMASGGLA
uniref:protein LURP-one-related 10-like n=1 Tax=Erigeron canadensis TaxID=72917 RepID=UPI001CB943F6|nr:protein LURP-one-related 10-like [Erigeron canadensis]